MSKPIHTLVVDDEAGIRFFLEETLQHAGHNVTTAHNGEDALAQLRGTSFDLILLDLNLGGRVDGLRVLETAKWRWPETAVIILTAHGTLDSALAAIREGVDGYLLKPVEPADVRQAVQEALTRRKLNAPKPILEKDTRILNYDVLFLDMDKHTVTRDGQLLALTPSEFQLLAYFMHNAQRVVTPRELVQVVREYDPTDDKEAREIIKWYIHRLRHKIEPDPSNPQYIINMRGVGYTFGSKAPGPHKTAP